jgi:hypothetical protein
MENKAKKVFDDNGEYKRNGKRGMMTVDIRDPNNPAQWHSSTRNFGAAYRDYAFVGELVINNGSNFDALVHGKVAFTRRTGKDSGTNYYQVLGHESFWPGAIISDDGNCICAFAGFTGTDDKIIAKSGITCYESLKRTGKSIDALADPSYEDEDTSDIEVPIPGERSENAGDPDEESGAY